jgi:hypothetical protein
MALLQVSKGLLKISIALLQISNDKLKISVMIFTGSEGPVQLTGSGIHWAVSRIHE